MRIVLAMLKCFAFVPAAALAGAGALPYGLFMIIAGLADFFFEGGIDF